MDIVECVVNETLQNGYGIIEPMDRCILLKSWVNHGQNDVYVEIESMFEHIKMITSISKITINKQGQTNH